MALPVLRRGTSARVRVTVVRGGKLFPFTGRSFSVVARYKGTEVDFNPTVSVASEPNSQLDLVFDAQQLSQSGKLVVEITVLGTPVINPPGQPIVLEVREPYEVA